MKQIGRYQIVGELGRGAMGVVYHATDPAIGRSVAIKTIRIRDIGDTRQREKLRDRLFREARSAGVLSHPNIVTIYDMDEADGLAYIAMAYVNGPTLEKILASEEPLSGAKMLRILRQAAAALDYAHARGIVHRDVKPANIMTDEDGSVKITDFGIAKITEGTQSTETRTVAGTPNYMSPEQVQGLAVDGRSDQFSLAVIAYEILTGERPFVGEHLSTIVFRIVAEDPPAAYRVNTTLTSRIDEVLRKALAKKAEDRFPNCSSFVGALELACAESRGWQTLPAGAAAAMPTIGVERTAPLLPATVPEGAFAQDEPVRKSRMIPVLLSLLLVSAVAAVFVYQAGLVGQQAPPAQQTAPETPKPEIAKVEPAPKPEPPPAELDSPKPEETTAKTDAAPPPEQTAPAPAPETSPPAVTEPAPVLRPKPSPAPRPTVAREESPRLQDIWVTSNPPGAKAVIDGNLAQACSTPCMLHGMPGRHNVAVSHAGFMNEYREVNVGDTATELPQITLRQPEGTLFLSTTPPGASIRVNGELVRQQTPAALKLPPARYSITVEKNGTSKTDNVTVGDGVVRLSIQLGP
jgi:serine/threonine-protein kinase